MRWKWFVAATIVAAVIIVGSLEYGRRSERVRLRQSALASATPPQSKEPDNTPLPQGPFTAIRPELERRARAGNADAAYQLGMVIAYCQNYKPLPFADLSAQIVEFVARGPKLQAFERSMEDDEVVGLVLAGQRKLQQICADAEGIRDQSPEREAFAWIEKAAALGHTKAMVEYQDRAFAEFRDDIALMENASVVALRRDRARLYLSRALHLGEAQALLGFANAYGAGTIMGEDPVKALAYWRAYERVATEDAFPTSLRALTDERFRTQLTVQQQRQASALSVRLAAGARKGWSQ